MTEADEKLISMPPRPPRHETSKLIVLMPGAFHTGKTFEALQAELEPSGHETVAITFENSNPRATAEYDAAQVAETIGNRRGVILVAWSRAIETMVRLPDVLEEGQLEGAIAYGTGGPHKYLLPLEKETGGVNPRYNTGYISGIRRTKNGLYIYDRAVAPYYFYHDLPEDVAEEAMDQMVPQRENNSEAPIKPWSPDLPTLLLLGRQDRILEFARARAVGRRYFQVNTEMMTGGHCLHLSQTKLLGSRILQFISDEINPLIS